MLVDRLQHINLKKNLKTLLVEHLPALAEARGRGWGSIIKLPSLDTVFINGSFLRFTTAAAAAASVVVEKPPRPHWRAGLGVVVLDSGPGRGMVVLVSGWVG